MNMNQFKQKSHINPKLIGAVIRGCYGYDEFKQIAKDVTDHGAACGFGRFIYYSDTLKFTARNRVAILELLKQDADNMGGSMLQTLAGFNCLKMRDDEAADGLYNSRSEYRTQVYNALAWYALEKVARSYCNLLEG